MTVDVSIVICTYNRAQMLSDTLQSWLAVDRAGIGTELVVVDNASTDGTRDVIAAAQHCSGFRAIAESRTGLSHARNAGIAAARGDIVAFVDDDIYFDPGWLRSLYGAFVAYPQVACVGGRSIPTFEVPRPEWISEAMLKFYGSTQSGDVDRPMVFPDHPFGVNMAFRRAVFERIGGFCTALGRRKASLLSNEEKEFFYRVHLAGMHVRYVANAVLQHRVTAERVSEDWLLRRAYWQGISGVIFDRYVGRNTRRALLRSLVRSAKGVLLGSANGLEPRSLYAYYRKPSLAARLHRHHQLGVFRQSAVEVFRPSLN